MPLRAVVFDFWETLVTNPPERTQRQSDLRIERLADCLERRGIPRDRAAIETAHRDVWRRCQELYWSGDRDIPTRTQVVHLLELLQAAPRAGDEATLAEIEEAYAGAALEIPPSVVPGAPDLLRGLKGRGLPTGLVCNTGRTPGTVLRRILERHDLARWIDVMVFSNEHGQCKPRPSIFEKVRAALGVPFADAVFVGDDLYVDVHGAQSVGMRAIHFVPPVKGTAVAHPVPHGRTIVPDARVTQLADVPAALAALA